MRHRLQSWAAFAALLLVPIAASAADLVFSVTEGVTYQATPKEIRDKFEPLAQALGTALKRTVRVVLVPRYDDMRAGLAKQEYDLAFIHPAHVALAEVKAGRYKTLAWTAGYTEYTVSLMVKANDPAKGLADVGATAATAVVKEWTDKGGRVFLKSRSVPIKYFIVSTKLPADEQAQIQRALVSLAQTDPGRQVLAAVGYKGFLMPDPAIDAAAIDWLGL